MKSSFFFKQVGLLILTIAVVLTIWLSINQAAQAQSINLTPTIEMLDGPKRKATITPIATYTKTPTATPTSTRTNTPPPTLVGGGE